MGIFRLAACFTASLKAVQAVLSHASSNGSLEGFNNESFVAGEAIRHRYLQTTSAHTLEKMYTENSTESSPMKYLHNTSKALEDPGKPQSWFEPQ